MSRKSKYDSYLNSEHWSRLRAAKFQQVGRKCQHCQSEKLLHVHHVNYRDWYSCVVDDLIVLCEDCHNDLHKGLNVKRMKPNLAPLQEAFRLIALVRIADKDFQERKAKWEARGPKKEKVYPNPNTVKLPKKHLAKVRIYREMRRLIRKFRNSSLDRQALEEMIDEFRKIKLPKASVNVEQLISTESVSEAPEIVDLPAEMVPF